MLKQSLNKAVFLDRDGILNKTVLKNNKPHPPASVDELELTDNAQQALNKLKDAGYLLIMVTNQPDVARGATTQLAVDTINDQLKSQLPLDAVRVCFHDDSDACACRKPKPGLITQAASDFNIDLSQSIMIGDRWKDIDAGVQAGCTSIWLQTNYNEKKPMNMDYTAEHLNDAADWILTTVSV